ncbi:hypothetical protein VTL71DRAFT_1778 [Oculimacula yallundae]|uniref:Major facilitator superfamily (MFS) profile domain-containing protein n=1 Tax=Oculimacula yallundae TaxID=86028 RepID=A0ABR4CBP4_9HELO
MYLTLSKESHVPIPRTSLSNKMTSFISSRESFEKEGVYVGGWSLRGVLTPKKRNGKHDSSEDKIEENTALPAQWTAKEESILVRKLDMRVLFPCTIVYFLAYLDRANIGAVKILGAGTPNSLEKSLGLVGKQFNWAVSITYFAVTVGLLPANIIMKKVSAKYFFPSIMVLWGIVVMSIAASENAAGLMTGRFFLGIPEAGVVPASIMYFSMVGVLRVLIPLSSVFEDDLGPMPSSRWYKPSERALRISVFHSANALAAAVSAFIASGIGSLQGAKGLNAWQWVFIIEGAAPIAISIPVFFLLLTFPETSTALSERQRFIAVNRLGRGAARKTDAWTWAAVRRIFSRPSTYVFFIAYVSVCIVSVAQGTFLPTILHVFLKFGPSKANLYTAIAALAIIPMYWIWGLHSDWTRERMWHFVVPMLISLPCYAVWTFVGTHPSTRGTSISTLSLYGMAFLGEMSLLAQPVLLSYRTSTLYGAAEQAVGGAAAIASLSIASILAPQMYPNQDSPNYVAGFTGTLGLIIVCIAAYLSLPFFLSLEASMRKKKTGHAIPLQALEDADNCKIASITREINHEDVTTTKAGYAGEVAVNLEEKGVLGSNHVERV